MKQIRTTTMPLACVAGLCFALATAAVHAQDAAASATVQTGAPGMAERGSSAATPFEVPMTQVISSTPGDYSAPETLSTGPIDERLNYRILSNRYLNRTVLDDAKAMHYSDRQIARILKVSKLTGMPMRDVLAMLQRGGTFPVIAQTYGIGFGGLKDVSKEIDQISEYRAALAATGSAGIKRPNVLGSQYPQPGSQGFILTSPSDSSTAAASATATATTQPATGM